MSSTLAPSPVLPFSLGDPASFAGLALIPLFPADEPRLEYVGLDEAEAPLGFITTNWQQLRRRQQGEDPDSDQQNG
ncbi:MAG: hypothetical protein WCH31_09015 [Actinomycetes bacterium]